MALTRIPWDEAEDEIIQQCMHLDAGAVRNREVVRRIFEELNTIRTERAVEGRINTLARYAREQRKTAAMRDIDFIYALLGKRWHSE